MNLRRYIDRAIKKEVRRIIDGIKAVDATTLKITNLLKQDLRKPSIYSGQSKTFINAWNNLRSASKNIQAGEIYGAKHFLGSAAHDVWRIKKNLSLSGDLDANTKASADRIISGINSLLKYPGW